MADDKYNKKNFLVSQQVDYKGRSPIWMSQPTVEREKEGADMPVAHFQSSKLWKQCADDCFSIICSVKSENWSKRNNFIGIHLSTQF